MFGEERSAQAPLAGWSVSYEFMADVLSKLSELNHIFSLPIEADLALKLSP